MNKNRSTVLLISKELFELRYNTRMKQQQRPQDKPGYTAHRERQRARILSASEDLFVRSGLDRVSMLEITAASDVQPSTL